MVGGRLLKRVGLEWPRNLCTILKMACALIVRTEEETPDGARHGPDVDLAMAYRHRSGEDQLGQQGTRAQLSEKIC